MKNTINLIKIYFKETLFSLFNINGKKNAKKNIITLSSLFVLILFAFGYQLYTFAKTLNDVGMAKNILLIGLFLSLFMVIMITVTDSQGVFYKSKDFDMLSSLPIKTSNIIIAKFVSSYLISLLYTVLAIIPTYVVYFIFCPISVVNIIFAIVSIILVPAFGQLICIVISWLINLISSRSKNKVIVRSVMSVIASMIIIGFVYLANNKSFALIFANNIPKWFKIVFAHNYFLYKSIVSNNVASFIYFCLICIGFILISTGILNIGYRRINTSFSVVQKRKKVKPLTFKSKSKFSGMIKKEAYTFVSNPVYLMNGIIGPLMAIVVSFIIFGVYKEIKSFQYTLEVVAIMEACVVPMCLGIAPTTSVSISMEGTRFYTLKSMPMKYQDIVNPKIVFGLILSIPFVVVADILFCVLCNVSMSITLSMICFGVLSTLAFVGLGMLMNLRFPKLNWTNASQVAKRGMSLIITMVVDMVVSIIPMVLYYSVEFIMTHCSIAQYLLLWSVIFVVINIVIYVLIYTKGKKFYSNI